jgi:hypothetical protein
MSEAAYKVRTRVWRYPGVGGWHFITLPEKYSEEINFRFGMRGKGWGSIPVIAIIGETEWTTSIFPDRKSRGYLLPVKAEVRRNEKIKSNDMATVTVRIRI